MNDLINRQAAIDVIEKWLECSDYNEAERHIMRATESILYDLPSVNQQEPCEDAISREKTLTAFADYVGSGMSMDDYDALWNIVAKMPSVKPQEQNTGHWIGIDEEPHEVWECDHCGFVIDGSGCIDPYDYRDTYKYCPYCGARMVEEQERSDKE